MLIKLLEPAAWLYYHNRGEPQLDVQIDEPDCIKSFPDDVVWKKPLFAQSAVDALVRSEERLAEYDRDWQRIIREVLACDPLPACKRADDQIEPPWEVIKRTRERAEQAEARVMELEGKLGIANADANIQYDRAEQAERRAGEMQEKCAKICDEFQEDWAPEYNSAVIRCAASIRGMGNERK